MLYLREKKWKESTKMAEFKQDIGGMESWIKIILGCGKISSENTLFADIWFSGVNTVDDASAEGVYFCDPINMSY